MNNKNDDDYFRNLLNLLNDYKWIYDFQVIDLFNQEILEKKFPNEWKTYFDSVNFDHFKELIKNDEIDHKCPLTLVELVKCLNKFRNVSFDNDLEYNDALVIDANLCRGISAKKMHEIKLMVPFVRHFCEKNQCSHLIDVGSGLSYFGHLLVNNSNISVIGIECKEDRVELADKRIENDARIKSRLVNVSCFLDEDCLENNKLFDLVESKMNTKLVDEKTNYGIISLHSCGDLTPTMLKLFLKEPKLKFLAAFSCCYHSMKLNDEQNFQNFPLSNALKSLFENDFKGFQLNVFAMRLACQQTISTWKEKKSEEHEAHMKQVAYRGILEKYCRDKNLKLTKLKRKLVHLNEFSSFETYIQSIKERASFEGEYDGQTLNEELIEYYNKYKSYFHLIEPLTALQVLIQPLLENLILKDRIAYLHEHNLLARLIRIFDDRVSPRSICILAERPTE